MTFFNVTSRLTKLTLDMAVAVSENGFWISFPVIWPPITAAPS